MASSDARVVVDAIIGAGDSASGAIKLGSASILAIMPPSSGSGDFDALTVYLLFPVSLDGTTYKILKDKDEAPIYVTIAEDNTTGAVSLDPSVFAGWKFAKVATYRSDKATEQTQTAETTIPLSIAKITG